jgi:hypothetical protein
MRQRGQPRISGAPSEQIRIFDNFTRSSVKRSASQPDTTSFLIGSLERAKGFEPSTPTLARSCSTTELHPHPRGRRWCSRSADEFGRIGRYRPRIREIGPKWRKWPLTCVRTGLPAIVAACFGLCPRYPPPIRVGLSGTLRAGEGPGEPD